MNLRLKDFFYHNSTERKATAIFIVIIIFLVTCTWLLPYLSSSKKYNFENYEQAISEFEANLFLIESEEELKFESKLSKRYPSEKQSKKNKIHNIESKELNPFKFDPNAADSNVLSNIGLNTRTIRSILNYRSKGGIFKTKSDFSKIYSLSEEDFNTLKPFLELPDSLESKNYSKKDKDFKNKAADKKSKYRIIEINTATEEDFKSLPGIGPSFASRIVKYRNLLGGFIKKEQISEVYGFPDSTFLKIEFYLDCDKNRIKRININASLAEDLKSHPYLRWKHANAIVKYREKNGPFRSIEMLRTIQEFDDSEGTFLKIRPYLSLK